MSCFEFVIFELACAVEQTEEVDKTLDALYGLEKSKMSLNLLEDAAKQERMLNVEKKKIR